MNLAIFWGKYDTGLKPEEASQHARLYLPTASEPAMIIATPPDMQVKSNPIPATPQGFATAWILSQPQLSAIKDLGFPGF